MDPTMPQPADSSIKQRLENDLSLKFSLLKTIKFLEASEYALIQLMVDNQIWIGPVPNNPGGTGDPEWGLIPYWVHCPPTFIQDYIESNDILKDAWRVLEFFLPAQIDTANYNALIARAETEGIVAADGTIYGDKMYEQLDPRWLFAAANYLIVVHFGDVATFSDKKVAPIPLQSTTNQDSVKIALVGDWGTGPFTDGEAVSLIQQVMGLSPDYLIHLGDVYYAGTTGDFLPPEEEMKNFLDYWPTTAELPAGNSFMLNSNHEMYSGAKGYFYVGLTDERFKQQLCTSYFALQYGGWTILGLDSAYYSSSAMFMDGSLGTNGVQTNWIQGLNLDPNKVILMTHHNALSADGLTEYTAYWDQVSGALKGDPAAWYWGHVHDGIAYKSPTKCGRTTLARCVGHSAIPYGNAFGVASSNQADYYAHTPTAIPPRVLNGFVLLTISSSGQITEEWFEQGNLTAKFTKTYG